MYAFAWAGAKAVDGCVLFVTHSAAVRRQCAGTLSVDGGCRSCLGIADGLPTRSDRW